MPAATAEQVVLQILRQAGGELSGKTRLFQAFYFAHLGYYQNEPGLLTDWPIVRMPNGPSIDRSDELLAGLVDKEWLQIEVYHEEFFPEYRYRLTEKAKTLSPLNERENRAIARAVEFVSRRSCAELSQFTREYSRSWLVATEGEPLNIYIDLVPEEVYHRRQADYDRVGPLEAALLAAQSNVESTQREMVS